MVRSKLRLLQDGVWRLVQSFPDQRTRGGEEGAEGGLGGGAGADVVMVGVVVAVALEVKVSDQILDLLGVNVGLGAVLGVGLERAPQIFGLSDFESSQKRHKFLFDIPLSGGGITQA